MKDWKTKDLRKAAFAVGFGFYFGKEVARLVDIVFNNLAASICKQLAKDGNNFAQEVCKKANVNYTEDQKKEESEIKMGFHV